MKNTSCEAKKPDLRAEAKKKYVFTFLFSFLLCQLAHPLSELTAGDCSQKQMIFSVRARNKIGILPQPLRPGPLLLNAAAMF